MADQRCAGPFAALGLALLPPSFPLPARGSGPETSPPRLLGRHRHQFQTWLRFQLPLLGRGLMPPSAAVILAAARKDFTTWPGDVSLRLLGLYRDFERGLPWPRTRGSPGRWTEKVAKPWSSCPSPTCAWRPFAAAQNDAGSGCPPVVEGGSGFDDARAGRRSQAYQGFGGSLVFRHPYTAWYASPWNDTSNETSRPAASQNWRRSFSRFQSSRQGDRNGPSG